MSDSTNPFEAFFDPARLARHEQLLRLWHGLPIAELLADINILVQVVQTRLAMREQQEAEARTRAQEPQR